MSADKEARPTGRAEPLPNRWVCAASDCGYDGLSTSDLRMSGGVDAAMLWFCPVCGDQMFRDDPLGQIERDAKGGAS